MSSFYETLGTCAAAEAVWGDSTPFAGSFVEECPATDLPMESTVLPLESAILMLSEALQTESNAHLQRQAEICLQRPDDEGRVSSLTTSASLPVEMFSLDCCDTDDEEDDFFPSPMIIESLLNHGTSEETSETDSHGGRPRSISLPSMRQIDGNDSNDSGATPVDAACCADIDSSATTASPSSNPISDGGDSTDAAGNSTDAAGNSWESSPSADSSERVQQQKRVRRRDRAMRKIASFFSGSARSHHSVVSQEFLKSSSFQQVGSSLLKSSSFQTVATSQTFDPLPEKQEGSFRRRDQVWGRVRACVHA